MNFNPHPNFQPEEPIIREDIVTPEDNSFIVNKDFVLNNKVILTDFFGNNRPWYNILRRGGKTYPGTSLNSKEYMIDHQDDEIKDLPPLDPEDLTERRADSVAKFFEENPDAKVDLLISIS